MSVAESVHTTTKPQNNNSNSLLIQRKCACGGSSGLSGQCDECKTNRLLGKPLQAKLRINEPGDEYELEADRVANQVMRMPDVLTPEASPSHTTPLVQRRTAENSAAGIAAAPPIVQDVLSSPGRPLDTATRAFFEPRFGHDFSRVRVHSDTCAMESARAVNALAYTVGNDIVFGAKPYVPGTLSENPLLAHELTHVVQQGGHRSDEARLQRRGEVGGGLAGEILSACDQPSGIDTIIFAPYLATDARAVQVYYRKEEPPGGTAQIFPADLSNLFPSHPLLAILLEQSCGGWIRFDITDLPPEWQGPSLEGDSITLWGLAPPPSPGTTTSEILQEPREHGLVFVANEFLFDFIVRRRQSAGKDDKEAFDLRVIDEFFAGIGEGLGKDFSDQWNTLMQTYAQHALFFPFLQYRLWLGALDGIAEQGADALVFVTKFAQDPQAFRDQMMKAIRRGILQPRSTSRKFGIAIGEDFKQQIGTLIRTNTWPSPSRSPNSWQKRIFNPEPATSLHRFFSST